MNVRPIRILNIFLSFIFLSCLGDMAPGADPADEFGLMYWTHRDEGVYRSARDGSDVKLLVPAKNADGLAIDQANGKLYFLVSNTPDKPDTLHRAKLDGTQAEQLVGELNWTETGKIGQANLDGSFIETLVVGKTAQYASLVVLPPRE